MARRMFDHIVRRSRGRRDLRLNPGLGTNNGGSASLLGSLVESIHERSKVGDGFSLVETEVIVQEEQKLLLHEVDLCCLEYPRKGGPVLVFRRRVVQVLRSNDESREEHAVASAGHPCYDDVNTIRETSGYMRTFCHLRQLVPQTLQVDQRREQCRDLNVRLRGDDDDEVSQGRERRHPRHPLLDLSLVLFAERRPVRSVRGSRQVRGRSLVADVDHPCRLDGDVLDYLCCDVLPHEVDKSRVVQGAGNKGGGMETIYGHVGENIRVYVISE